MEWKKCEKKIIRGSMYLIYRSSWDYYSVVNRVQKGDYYILFSKVLDKFPLNIPEMSLENCF